MSDESERVGGDDEKCSGEIEWDEGDPRVLLVTNLVLSTMFTAVAVYGLSYIDLAASSVINVASAALALTAVTHLVVN